MSKSPVPRTPRLTASLSLLASLRDFQSSRVYVRGIFEETRRAWDRWQDKLQELGSCQRRTSETPSTPDDSPVCYDPLSFDREMQVVVRLLEDKPTLVLVGRLKSGKSTLINAILRHHVLPSDEGPCTARMVKLKPLSKGKAFTGVCLQVLKSDGTRMGDPVTLESVKDSQGVYQSRLLVPRNIIDVGHGTTPFAERSKTFRDEEGQQTERGAWVEILHPHPLLEYIHIVDSPGKGENKALDDLVNEEACSGLVQTIVYVINGCHGLTTEDINEIRSLKNQMKEDSNEKAKLFFVCTRIDEVLQEDTDEEPNIPDDLPSDSEDDDIAEDSTVGSDSDDFVKSALQGSTCRIPRYSTKIHERVFNALVREGFLNDLEEDQRQSYDRCSFFHCVSAFRAAEAAQSSSDNTGVEENPFLRDFLQFEESLSTIIVEQLNTYATIALKELVRKQKILIETMFQLKFSLTRKAIRAEQKLQFIIKTEEQVYMQFKAVLGSSRVSKVQKIVQEEKEACLGYLPKEAENLKVSVGESVSNRKGQDLAVANQVREYVCEKFNERFLERVRHVTPSSNLGETVQRCATDLQKETNESLDTVRLVSTFVQAAYSPIADKLTINKGSGLPLKLRIKTLFNTIFHRKQSYTKSWKNEVARHCLKSFDAESLAQDYCRDLQQKLEEVHSLSGNNIKRLESMTQSTVHSALGQQRKVRIEEGHELASVFLKSESLLNRLRHSVPEKGDKIGEGQSGTVHRCLDGKWGHNVVIKVRKRWPPPTSEEPAAWPASLYFSVECLDHNNIQKAIGFIVPPEAPEGELWVLETSCLCSLEDVLQGSTQLQLNNFPWLEIGNNVVDGLVHLFCQGIPHHNIKPSNVLLSDSCEAKLCDMGMYDIVSMKQRQKITRAAYFVAPEMAKSDSEIQGVATSDVYSVAILLWYLFKGYSEVGKFGKVVPDPENFTVCNKSVSAFFAMVCNSDRPLRPEVDEWNNPDHVLCKAATLMQQCWNHDSADRFDCARLRHEFQEVKEKLQK